MSRLTRRMDRLDAALVGGSEALRITAQYAAMTDRELLKKAARLAGDIRDGRVVRTFETSGPPSVLFGHLTNEELLRDYEAGKRLVAEEHARLGIVPKSTYLGRDST